MRDREDGAVLEFGANRLLDQLVGLHVACRRRLVQNKNFGLSEHSARQAHQLALANAEVLTALGNNRVESPRELLDGLFEMADLEGAPELLIRVHAEWIEIGAHTA